MKVRDVGGLIANQFIAISTDNAVIFLWEATSDLQDRHFRPPTVRSSRRPWLIAAAAAAVVAGRNALVMDSSTTVTLSW